LKHAILRKYVLQQNYPLLIYISSAELSAVHICSSSDHSSLTCS